MKETPTETIPKPFLLRFMLWAGGPFGFAFAPDQHVRVLYRMGRYRGVRGPGLFRYEKFLSESLGSLVYIGPQTMTFTFTQLLTRDNLALTAQAQVTACYDPRAAPAFAPNLTGVSSKTRESVVQSYLTGACLSIFNQYGAEQMTQQAQRTRLEFEITARFTKEIGPLGFALPEGQRVRLLTITLPPRIAERHELIAQRRLNITAANEMLPEDLRRTLIIEVLENLGKLGGGNAHISFNEVLDQYILDHHDTYGRFIEHRPPPREITPPEDAPPEPPEETRPGPRSRL